MDYAPLVLLAVVAVGAAVLFRYMSRLKRSALQALEQARSLDVQVRSWQAQDVAGGPGGQAAQEGSPQQQPSRDDPPPQTTSGR
ncbi:MAG: hypothetical protein ACR2G7_12035 [Acidimicrobiales bacterium]